ncbi:hypothetical protein [Oleiharenicola lentus]|uniref:hypothetical protein n=1 Tax=Oleiharenicola lentus TaxID=2508720 RepID=UPI003F662E1B
MRDYRVGGCQVSQHTIHALDVVWQTVVFPYFVLIFGGVFGFMAGYLRGFYSKQCRHEWDFHDDDGKVEISECSKCGRKRFYRYQKGAGVEATPDSAEREALGGFSDRKPVGRDVPSEGRTK